LQFVPRGTKEGSFRFVVSTLLNDREESPAWAARRFGYAQRPEGKSIDIIRSVVSTTLNDLGRKQISILFFRCDYSHHTLICCSFKPKGVNAIFASLQISGERAPGVPRGTRQVSFRLRSTTERKYW
jgi:hypothetical protein